MSARRKHQRLSNLLQTSKYVEFNDDDRFVFFSDVHRGNNSWADEFARNQIIYSYALQHYFDAGYTYVEVGDGDELLKFKDIRTIRIAHEQVYFLLQQFHREGRFYYLFGNHDYEYRNPEKLASKLNHHFRWFGEIEDEVLFDNFCVYESLIFKHKETGVAFLCAHGHQGEFFNDGVIWFNRLLLRSIWHPLQLLGLQDPGSVSKNVLKRHKIEQQLVNWVIKNNQPLICGHTHQEHFPKQSTPPYFNTGSCVHPRWITCIEIKNGEIALVRWRIKPRKKGTLFVKRGVLQGPRKISDFSADLNWSLRTC